jgi:5-methylthioadenosine/S-adenosylhomocysteine deaminase
MKTLITDAHIIPMDTDTPHWMSGDIGIDSETISFIGTVPDDFQPDTVIDAAGGIVMPGLVNAHTHLSMTLLRNYADDMELFSWLTEKIWPLEEKMSEEHIYWGSMLGLAEQIRGGITCFADMYFHQHQTADAVISSGTRASIGATFMGDKKATLARLGDTRALHQDYHGAGGGRIHIDIAPHAIYTCSRETLEIITDLALELDSRIHIHVSETLKELRDSLKEHGKTPPAYLEEVGLFRAPVYAAHCVHLEPGDYPILSEYGVSPIHNPTSNLKLGSGFAGLPTWFEQGLTPALGTDGASSNNNLDMFEEIHLASIIHKGLLKDPTVIPAYQALRMATRGGAHALGILDTVGTLEVGKQADLLIINTNKPHLQPMNNPISAAAYCAGSADVDTLMCAGRIIMHERQLLTIDEQEVLHKAAEAAEELIQRTQ